MMQNQGGEVKLLFLLLLLLLFLEKRCWRRQGSDGAGWSKFTRSTSQHVDQE